MRAEREKHVQSRYRPESATPEDGSETSAKANAVATPAPAAAQPAPVQQPPGYGYRPGYPAAPANSYGYGYRGYPAPPVAPRHYGYGGAPYGRPAPYYGGAAPVAPAGSQGNQE